MEKRERGPDDEANADAERDGEIRVRSAVGEDKSVYERRPQPAGDGVTTKTELAGEGRSASEMDIGTSEIHPDLEKRGGLTPPDSPRGPARP